MRITSRVFAVRPESPHCLFQLDNAEDREADRDDSCPLHNSEACGAEQELHRRQISDRHLQKDCHAESDEHWLAAKNTRKVERAFPEIASVEEIKGFGHDDHV